MHATHKNGISGDDIGIHDRLIVPGVVGWGLVPTASHSTIMIVQIGSRASQIKETTRGTLPTYIPRFKLI